MRPWTSYFNRATEANGAEEETSVNDPALVEAACLQETVEKSDAADSHTSTGTAAEETTAPKRIAIPLTTLAATCKLSVAEVDRRVAEIYQQIPDWRKVEWEMQNLKAIPALSELARRFMHAMSREEVIVDEVVASIAHDPALCVGVLRLANSVYIGSREPVVGLPDAVQMIGVRRVRQMASTLQLFRDSSALGNGLEWKHLWLHALATQLLAERLNECSGDLAGPGLPACAILHDVGKIALASQRPEEYKDVLLGAWQARQSLTELELAKLGMDHREAGWIFAAEAGLPSLILDTIAYHDEPERAHPDHRSTVALVAVANQLAKQHGLGFSGDGTCPETEIWHSPQWDYWQNSLDGPLETADFAAKEADWIYEVRRELQLFGG